MSALLELTAEECMSLLATREVGRLAMVTTAGLRIFPVNYALFGDAVVFRTLPYGEIANNAQGAEVAFQIDDLDSENRAGWSVLVSGHAHRVEDHAEVQQIRTEWDPEPWAEGQRNLYFRIDWTFIGGRQIGDAARPSLIPTTRSAL